MKPTITEEIQKIQAMMGVLDVAEILNENIILFEEDEEQNTPEGNSADAEKTADNFEKTVDSAQIDQGDGEQAQLPKTQSGLTDFTIKVPTYMERALDKVILSMIKTAKKMNIAPPQVTKGKRGITKIYMGEDAFLEPQYYAVETIDVDVKMDGVFRMPGNYELVAIVDNLSGGSFPTTTERIPAEFLAPKGTCDYCHSNRQRNKDFIIKSQTGGDYKRLGSDCVRKFLGINPGKYVSALNVFAMFRATMNEFSADDEGMGGGSRKMPLNPNLRVVDLDKAVTVVHSVMLNDGGLIKRQWEERDNGSRWGGTQKFRTNMGEATADKAEDIMFSKEFPNIKVDKQYVTDFITYLNNLELRPNSSEFMIKVKEIPNIDFRIKDCSFLAIAISMFEENKAKALKPQSHYLGEVGTQIKIKNAKVVDVKYGEGAYGLWTLWMFEDENGNAFKKFGALNSKFRTQNAPEGSPNLYGDIYKGDIFAFTTTVKKNEEYNGQKSSMIDKLSKF